MILEPVIEVLIIAVFDIGIFVDKIGGFVRYTLHNTFYHIIDKEKKRDLKSFYKPQTGKKTEEYDIHFTNSVIGSVFLLILLYILAELIG